MNKKEKPLQMSDILKPGAILTAYEVPLETWKEVIAKTEKKQDSVLKLKKIKGLDKRITL